MSTSKTTKPKLEIESWEDRSGQVADGHPEWAFGYVYFNDGSRVGFSMTKDTPPVWQPRTNGGGQHVEVTKKHLTMALDMLAEVGIMTPEVLKANWGLG